MKNYRSIFAGAMILLGTQTAMADECQLDITGNDAMQFNTAELSVPNSCTEVTVTLTHTGKLANNIMGHNWVLTTADDFKDVANAGMSAGLDSDYLPKDDARVLASTKIIGGGDKTSVTFSLATLPTGKEYTFFCSYPGHWAIMKGVFKVAE